LKFKEVEWGAGSLIISATTMVAAKHCIPKIGALIQYSGLAWFGDNHKARYSASTRKAVFPSFLQLREAGKGSAGLLHFGTREE
jgi:hypothetical protein